MPSLMDARFTALRNLGFTGSSNDMFFAWLKTHSTVQTGTIQDQLREFLITRGITPPFQNSDAWHLYLGFFNYSGLVNDRELAFWESGATLIEIPG